MNPSEPDAGAGSSKSSNSRGSNTPLDGRSPIELPGFSYLPRFITASEGDALIAYFGEIVAAFAE